MFFSIVQLPSARVRLLPDLFSDFFADLFFRLLLGSPIFAAAFVLDVLFLFFSSDLGGGGSLSH